MSSKQTDILSYYKHTKNAYKSQPCKNLNDNCSKLNKISPNVIHSDIDLQENSAKSLVEKMTVNIIKDEVKHKPDKNRKSDLEEITKALGKCSNISELREKLKKTTDLDRKLKQFKTISARKEIEFQAKLPASPHKGFLIPSKGSPLKTKPSSPFKATTQVTRPILSSPYKLSKARNPHPQLEQFKSIELEVPKSPIKSPAKLSSPYRRSPLVSRPAYERFSNLVKPSTSECQLVLPHSYQLIKESFMAVDTVISMLYNRQETITFTKLKPAVQKMSRIPFSEFNLGQLNTIFPLGYTFKQEKVQMMNECGVNVSTFQLTITPNLNYKPKTATKNLLNEFNSACKKNKMDTIVLVERRRIFHDALLNIVKKHHSKFLQTLHHKIVIGEENITNWHPEFCLEDIDVPEASHLPQPPIINVAKSAKDLMEDTNKMFINNRMKMALKTAVESTSTIVVTEKSSTTETKPVVVSSVLKGIPEALLKKIRAREAAKVAREMSRSTVDSEELQILSHLPELAKVLRNIFVTAKKAAILWDTVATQTSQSHSANMSIVDSEIHIRALMTEIPDWCKIHKLSKAVYLKLDKKLDVNDVVTKLQQISKERS